MKKQQYKKGQKFTDRNGKECVIIDIKINKIYTLTYDSYGRSYVSFEVNETELNKYTPKP